MVRRREASRASGTDAASRPQGLQVRRRAIRRRSDTTTTPAVKWEGAGTLHPSDPDHETLAMNPSSSWFLPHQAPRSLPSLPALSATACTTSSRSTGRAPWSAMS